MSREICGNTGKSQASAYKIRACNKNSLQKNKYQKSHCVFFNTTPREVFPIYMIKVFDCNENMIFLQELTGVRAKCKFLV